MNYRQEYQVKRGEYPAFKLISTGNSYNIACSWINANTGDIEHIEGWREHETDAAGNSVILSITVYPSEIELNQDAVNVLSRKGMQR